MKMKFIKLDNEPCDIGHIAIHDDFCVSPDGNWIINNDTLAVYTPEDGLMVVLVDAQETVDNIIRDLINLQ